jgi:hypothetical protein
LLDGRGPLELSPVVNVWPELVQIHAVHDNA